MYNTLQEVTQREDELGREHGSYLHLTLYPRKKQSSRYVFIWCGKWISYKKGETNIFFSKFWVWNIHDLYFTFGWLENDYCTITVFDFSLLDYEWWKISKGRLFTLFNFWFIFFLHFFWLKEENPLMCIGHTSASEDDSRNFKPHYETWFDSVQERSRFFLLNMKNVISVNNFQGIHTYKTVFKKVWNITDCILSYYHGFINALQLMQCSPTT